MGGNCSSLGLGELLSEYNTEVTQLLKSCGYEWTSILPTKKRRLVTDILPKRAELIKHIIQQYEDDETQFQDILDDLPRPFNLAYFQKQDSESQQYFYTQLCEHASSHKIIANLCHRIPAIYTKSLQYYDKYIKSHLALIATIKLAYKLQKSLKYSSSDLAPTTLLLACAQTRLEILERAYHEIAKICRQFDAIDKTRRIPDFSDTLISSHWTTAAYTHIDPRRRSITATTTDSPHYNRTELTQLLLNQIFKPIDELPELKEAAKLPRSFSTFW